MEDAEAIEDFQDPVRGVDGIVEDVEDAEDVCVDQA